MNSCMSVLSAACLPPLALAQPHCCTTTGQAWAHGQGGHPGR
jgi:hypothetical protein